MRLMMLDAVAFTNPHVRVLSNAVGYLRRCLLAFPSAFACLSRLSLVLINLHPDLGERSVVVVVDIAALLTERFAVKTSPKIQMALLVYLLESLAVASTPSDLLKRDLAFKVFGDAHCTGLRTPILQRGELALCMIRFQFIYPLCAVES